MVLASGNKINLPVKLLLFISFLEGGAVMIIELLGAKIIAPYYGVSLYVWSSVLGVTLGALAVGYFAGGLISKKYPGSSSLFTVILIGAFFTALAPLTAPKILVFTEFMGVKMGSLVSVLLYLLIPVACFGSVSPIIIQLINNDTDEAGRTAGTVYAISTVGGIIATFMTGFYLIPTIGIKLTAFITAGVLAGISLTYFLVAKKYMAASVPAVMALIVFLFIPSQKVSDDIRVAYRSIGILGEWSVVEKGNINDEKQDQVEKLLLLNGITQTYTQKGFEPLSLWTYPHKIGAYAGIKPEGSKALLLGMGGGSIAFELLAMGMDLDIVELDGRVREIASSYFNYNPASANLYIDDARHYIRTTNESYDLVIIDLVLGEVQPAHVFSREGFEDLKKVIRDDALVIINFQGNIDDPELSLGARSIYKTLEASGFHIDYYASRDNQNATNDIFFLASLADLDYVALMKDLRYNEWFLYDNFEYQHLISEEPVDLSDALVLIDDKPMLELINAKTILQWRQNKSELNLQLLLDQGV
ncbi:MAG: hypothetical protein GY751_01505 [Bacteroidetes bacterium]|nr:hypothetical protein [Bacteroidota bacterium]